MRQEGKSVNLQEEIRHAGTGVGDIVEAWFLIRMLRSLANTFTSAFAPHEHAPETAAADKSGRMTDQHLHPDSESSTHGLGTLFVVCAFLVSVTAGVGFLIAYWTGGSNQALGGCLALFLGGIGAALVGYSHGLIAERQAIEPREELPSSTEERERVWEEYCSGAHDVRRRGLLTWMGLGATGFVGAIVISLFRSLGASPSPSLYSTIWKRGQRLTKSDGTPVTIDALRQGNTMIVFPEDSIGDERAQTVLVRVNESQLQLPEGRASWAPMGYVAYSRVCTHAGCPVGMFETTTNLLMCPCHQSTFDVLRGARPTGGPAVRALPQLPLYADVDGTLRAGGGFSQPPGPGFWDIPA